MDLILVLCIALFAASSAAISLFFLYRKGKTDETYSFLNDIADNVDSGFYWRDMTTGKSIFSGNFRKMLNLQEEVNDLESLLGVFDSTQQSIIRQALDDLESVQTSAIMTLNMHNSPQQFECRIRGAYNKDRKLTHIIVTLKDTTSSYRQHEQMIKENKQLKRDVKQFS